jgi:hypothetical protein
LEGPVFERRARSTHSVRAQPSEDNPFRPRRARPTGRARATGRGPRPDTRVSRGRGAPRPTERPAPPARVNGMHLHFRLQEDPPTLSRKREGENSRERPTTLAPHTRVTTPASLAAHDGVPSPRVHPDATLGDFEQIEQSERCTCSAAAPVQRRSRCTSTPRSYVRASGPGSPDPPVVEAAHREPPTARSARCEPPAAQLCHARPRLARKAGRATSLGSGLDGTARPGSGRRSPRCCPPTATAARASPLRRRRQHPKPTRVGATRRRVDARRRSPPHRGTARPAPLTGGRRHVYAVGAVGRRPRHRLHRLERAAHTPPLASSGPSARLVASRAPPLNRENGARQARAGSHANGRRALSAQHRADARRVVGTAHGLAAGQGEG